MDSDEPLSGADKFRQRHVWLRTQQFTLQAQLDALSDTPGDQWTDDQLLRIDGLGREISELQETIGANLQAASEWFQSWVTGDQETRGSD